MLLVPPLQRSKNFCTPVGKVNLTVCISIYLKQIDKQIGSIIIPSRRMPIRMIEVGNDCDDDGDEGGKPVI